ncbi:hypothetical protein DRF65_16580 [Chryseobacterium pennae]|uniref:Nucleotidyltransferase domain-containing protein n=1 Tax=Chryseobacterium pennae TaxID=2258962 RepID=A0A3D9C627_9FLAO|nr:aminoglycoside 6-adenylyltransferase [Chryseobacterium pennae]REC61330.1 hypothetical protein DRF65_16580 [Chryseobacterium pennae]
MLTERIEQINQGIEKVLNHNQDIKALISVGSFSQGHMDQFSDIDMYVFTTIPKKYMNHMNDSWISHLGNIISRRVFRDFGEGIDKNKIILDNGLMYDITIVDLSRFNMIKYYFMLKKYKLIRILPRFLRRFLEGNIIKFYSTIQRGYKVHRDKINLEKILIDAINFSKTKAVTLTERQFLNGYNFFWQSCYTASVKLIREEFYYTLLVYDYYLKKELIWMIEQKCLFEDKEKDVYYNGQKIRQWEGIDVYRKLYDTLLKEDIISMQNALIQTAELYQEYAGIVAAKNGFKLNVEFEKFVLNFIKNVAIPERERQQEFYRN